MIAAFDGGRITSDAGALLLGAVDRAIRLTRRMAAFFADTRNPLFIEHKAQTPVLQRVVGIALGHEDLNDHDQLRDDPVMATLTARRHRGCAPLAGESTLNRLELSRAEPTRYHKLARNLSTADEFAPEVAIDISPLRYGQSRPYPRGGSMSARSGKSRSTMAWSASAVAASRRPSGRASAQAAYSACKASSSATAACQRCGQVQRSAGGGSGWQFPPARPCGRGIEPGAPRW